MEKEIKMTNELEEVSRLAEFIEEICEELSLPAETTMKLNLALEEAVCNVIMYAYPIEENHEIRLKAKFSVNQLVFLLTDKGASFDPTTVAEANLGSSIEDRQIGGLGIFLIRSIMNEVTYQRLGDENQLIMKKNL